jgi:hypothetical protein
MGQLHVSAGICTRSSLAFGALIAIAACTTAVPPRPMAADPAAACAVLGLDRP